MKRRKRKISTTVYLEAEHLDHLGKVARKTGRPMAAIIRRGVFLALAEIERDEKAKGGDAQRQG